LFGLISFFSPLAFAADQKEEVKPYPLDYCIVDGAAAMAKGAALKALADLYSQLNQIWRKIYPAF